MSFLYTNSRHESESQIQDMKDKSRVVRVIRDQKHKKATGARGRTRFFTGLIFWTGEKKMKKSGLDDWISGEKALYYLRDDI